MKNECETDIIVRYAETDQMGVVYHANYLVWFEAGRTDFLAELGFPYSKMEEQGYIFPASDASLRFYSGARYEERLKVVTKLGEVRSRGLSFSYEVVREGQRLVSGLTKHICADRNMKVQKLPPDLFRALENLIKE